MRAGQLNRRITIQSNPKGPDRGGQPQPWSDIGNLWASIRHQTGLGALKGTQASGLPVSEIQYSLLVRFSDAKALGVKAGMRVLHDGHIFTIQGVSQDFWQRDALYLICEIADE